MLVELAAISNVLPPPDGTFISWEIVLAPAPHAEFVQAAPMSHD
jgi:hypothetical protein